PPVRTYVDKGLGASILRAGLRLWDGGSLSPAAAIKVTRQNLYRPTALIHETGHQVAHIVGWNEELAAALSAALAAEPPELAATWAGWSSEIAADTYAFAHTGYGSVAALHDVVSAAIDRKSTRLNSSHQIISYAVFCLKKTTAPASIGRLC